ncbi:metal ABC transporter solute-binding protein, Zn/Mn family [Mangrovitalea sediminis]|uniref:metal ABC transporter solute-binding protein, Zn/Mn family n=1 Tax=Mangrovitalea sediminis TaxID=1982043 RepID=UPI000BE54465|nr:zinc ABC transporter substrate-binding protein [Mangrovitalea sediminis]
MKRLTRLVGFILILVAGYGHAAVRIVAAENVYGNIAQQIGGDEVVVTSILKDPNQDPHMFEASPSIAVALAKADLVIVNGADYDPWANKLIGGSPSKRRQLLLVSALVGAKSGANPHLWYDPKNIQAVAQDVAERLSQVDPVHRKEFAHNLEQFRAKMRPLENQIHTMRQRFHGTPVTATEPVFGYMADSLGLSMRNTGFQLAVMNNVEPGASEVAALEGDLRQRKVAALIYNRQVTDSTTAHFLALAKKSGVPVVGVTETEPTDQDYVHWMQSQLDRLEKALEQFR